MKDNQLSPIKGNRFTPQVQRLACRIYAETPSIADVADACGVSVRTIRRHLAADPTFAECMDHARSQFVGKLEKAAFERATEGHTQSKPGPGGIFYDVTTKSDALLIHLLKKLAPEVHGDKTIVQHIDDNNQSMDLENLTPENRALLEQILRGQLKSSGEIQVDIEPIDE